MFSVLTVFFFPYGLSHWYAYQKLRPFWERSRARVSLALFMVVMVVAPVLSGSLKRPD